MRRMQTLPAAALNIFLVARDGWKPGPLPKKHQTGAKQVIVPEGHPSESTLDAWLGDESVAIQASGQGEVRWFVMSRAEFDAAQAAQSPLS